MSTPIQGLRGTGEFGVDFRPKNYRELFTLLEPNGSAPFNALLAMANSESTDDPEFKNFRDEMPDRTLKINLAAGYNTTATALTVDSDTNCKFVVTGALIVNVDTGEVMRASADSSANTAIIRLRLRAAWRRSTASGLLSMLCISHWVSNFMASCLHRCD